MSQEALAPSPVEKVQDIRAAIGREAAAISNEPAHDDEATTPRPTILQERTLPIKRQREMMEMDTSKDPAFLDTAPRQIITPEPQYLSGELKTGPLEKYEYEEEVAFLRDAPIQFFPYHSNPVDHRALDAYFDPRKDEVREALNRTATVSAFALEDIPDRDAFINGAHETLGRYNLERLPGIATAYGLMQYLHQKAASPEYRVLQNPQVMNFVFYTLAQEYGFRNLTLKQGKIFEYDLSETSGGFHTWVEWDTKWTKSPEHTVYRFDAAYPPGGRRFDELKDFDNFMIHTSGFPEVATHTT